LEKTGMVLSDTAKKKETFAEKKLTQAEIALRVE
jgi:hypothetical protein